MRPCSRAANLHVKGAATMAGPACLSAPGAAQRRYCPASRCLRGHAETICRPAQAGVGQGSCGRSREWGVASAGGAGLGLSECCMGVGGGGSSGYHLVSCQLLSGLLFTCRHLVKLW